MGCCSSSTAVSPLEPKERGDEDEAGSKVDNRGDSAVSKGTTDSGVVMDKWDIPVLPGVMPRRLPPLSSECVREIAGDRITLDEISPRNATGKVQERPKSSEILEELLNQGIIPVEQSGERSSKTGESYNIMLEDSDGVRRKPPVRLESLKAKKAQSVPSIENIEEKIRLAEERRKLREEKLKMRLRIKSARVRGPAPTSSAGEDEDEALTPVESRQLPPTPNPLDPLRHSQITGEEAEGREWVREVGGDDTEMMGKTEQGEGRREKVRERGDTRGESAERVSEDGDGEKELTQVKELMEDSLLPTSEELESDSSV
ncbi:stathmin domain-containing protein 1 [Clinocottus analis]|uniref:stathmin domain-containing protein 1 n=1 Tax=Clinocottus analis TaxID=304258 RepID=UPI0035BEBC14